MRWAILAVLTLSRMSMAFTFQSVAALGPFLLTERAISYGGLGTLVGAFMFAGVVVAVLRQACQSEDGDRLCVIAVPQVNQVVRRDTG